jgi:hypothetical protein
MSKLLLRGSYTERGRTGLSLRSLPRRDLLVKL